MKKYDRPTKLLNVVINPKRVTGKIKAPSSKSHAIRAILCAALSKRQSVIEMGWPPADDINSALRAVRSMGGESPHVEGGWLIVPPTIHRQCAIDCGESGAVLRFFTPVQAAFGNGVVAVGNPCMWHRPQKTMRDYLEDHGCKIEIAEKGIEIPFSAVGEFVGGEFDIPGDVSSQFLSGVLFAAPLLKQDSYIKTSPTLESRPYVEMTLAALRQSKIQVDQTEYGFFVPGNQQYEAPSRVTIEGDWSSAAAILALGALGGPVTVSGLNMASLQGDKRIVELLEKMGAIVTVGWDEVTVARDGRKKLNAIEVDVSDIPDLVPVLAALACHAKGKSRIYNAGRLVHKESDRLQTVRSCLTALGGKVQKTDSELIIQGASLTGAAVSCHNDHRIAMMLAVAATRCKGGVLILEGEAVAKSYPMFYEHVNRLGGDADIYRDEVAQWHPALG